MTVTSALTAFALVALLMTLVPGVDTALILRSAMTRGRSDAMVAALGISNGVFIWGIAAAAGASAVLAASHLAYQILTYAGAAYLVFLGGQMIYRSFRKKEVEAIKVEVSRSKWRNFTTGMITNLLNPKIGVFYILTEPKDWRFLHRYHPAVHPRRFQCFAHGNRSSYGARPIDPGLGYGADHWR